MRCWISISTKTISRYSPLPISSKRSAQFHAQVGNEAATSEGARALWNAVTGPFKATCSPLHKKKDDFIAAGQADEYSIQLNDITQRRVDAEGKALPLDVVIYKQVIKGREELMKQSGICTDKATRNSIIINETATRVKTLIIEGRLDDADNMLNAMEDTVIGGRRMFNTGEARRVTNQLYADLVSARNSTATRSIASQKQEFTGRWTTNLLSLNSFDTGAEVPDQTIGHGASDVGYVEHERSRHRGDHMRVTIVKRSKYRLCEGVTTTLHYVWRRQRTGLLRFHKASSEILSKLTLRKRVVTSPDEKEGLEASYREWAKNNDGTIEEWKASLGEEGNFETFPDLKKAQSESLQGGFVKDVPAYKAFPMLMKTSIRRGG